MNIKTRVMIIIALFATTGLFSTISLTPATAHAQDDDESCLMVVEVSEIRVNTDIGDAVYGIFGGDMEFQFYLALSNGIQTWETTYPDNDEWIERVEEGDTIDLDDFRLMVDMNDFRHDEVYIYFLAVDADPIQAFGRNLIPDIRRIGDDWFSNIVEFIAPDDVAELATFFLESGVETFIQNISSDDVIGQGGIFLDEENGWGTSEIKTYITREEGIEVTYQVFLIGEQCDTTKRSA